MDKYIGKKMVADPIKFGFKVCNQPGDEKIVYGMRFVPTTSKELEEFGEARHNAYELYIICKDGVIEDINQRVDQCQCCQHSHAPNGAPAWLFPDGAMFDIPVEDIVKSVRVKMAQLLRILTATKSNNKRKI